MDKKDLLLITSWALGRRLGSTLSRLDMSCFADEEILFQVRSSKVKLPCEETHFRVNVKC